MKRKTNLKEKAAVVKQGKTPIESAPLFAKELLDEHTHAKAIFQSAITQLQASRFNSLEEAIDKIADLVLEKMKLPEEMQTEYKQLLNVAFETDLGLQAELRRSVKIG